MKPKISVYITNYNYGEYIEEAIESVLNQSEQDFELIIIDDGSTDNSYNIIKKYENYPKISIIYQQNKGLNASNNVAMNIARGKYLIRLDADDYFHKDALKLLSQELDNNIKLGLVFPNYFIVDSENNIISEIKRHDFGEVTLFDQPAHGACTMIRIDYLKKVGGYYEGFSCQDGYDLWIKFITHYEVKNIPQSLFFYRQHNSNLTKNEDRLLDTRIEMKKKFFIKQNKKLPRTIGIIPVRSLDINQICLETINGKTLLEKKIEIALKAELLEKVVVVASDKKIFEFINTKFKNNSHILCIERPKEFGNYTSSLYKTIKLIFTNKEIKLINPISFVLLSLEFPFIPSKMIDNAIRTSVIFQADTVISIRLDPSSRYKHNGSTLVSLENSNLTKYERDDIYIAKGGLTYSTYKNLLKHKKLPSGKIGHIIISQLSSMEIKTKIDLDIAKCVENSILNKKDSSTFMDLHE